jgi:hypothetical protein
MPNIIEQQDLLKGLPDSRLALLMQKPIGDIPPFLVAAEAQRRQSIRQQFAGDGNKESVVDSLTKAMSNVPQNLNAPMQAPPQMPAPMAPPMDPQMQGGIGSIPQGQPQTMAEGGIVSGYGPNAGKTTPMWSIPDYSGTIPRVMDWVGSSTKNAYDYLTTPYSEKPAASNITEQVDAGYVDPFAAAKAPAPYGGKVVQPRNAAAGQDSTSDDNQTKPAEDEIRQRIDALYDDPGLSSWEKSQKWFAMSQQFLDPSKTTMQSIAGAGAAFADSMSGQAQSERENARAREEALLRYDIGVQDDQRSSEAAGLKARTDVATGQLDDLYRQQRDIAGQLRSIDESIVKDGTDPAQVAGAKEALTSQMMAIGSKIAAYEKFIGTTYGFGTIPVVDLQNNRIFTPGT